MLGNHKHTIGERHWQYKGDASFSDSAGERSSAEEVTSTNILKFPSTQFFRVENQCDWGDYGAMLVCGEPVEETTDYLELMRAGPFVPPLTLPYHRVIVTTAMLAQFKQITDVEVKPVRKVHIADLPWETWQGELPDIISEVPAEPDDILRHFPHSASAAEQMGDLWQLKFRMGATMQSERRERRILQRSWNGDSMFFADIYGSKIFVVTEEGRQWLEEHAGPKWLTFEPLAIK